MCEVKVNRNIKTGEKEKKRNKQEKKEGCVEQRMFSLLLLLVFAAAAHEHGHNEEQHRCIHDELQELGRIRAAAAPHRFEHDNEHLATTTTTTTTTTGGGARKRADVSVSVPMTHTPIRVLLDFTFLNADADPYGLCVKVGQWARIGNPPASSIETHMPICSEKCDSVDSMIGAGATCDCWFQCTDSDIFYRQKREVLVDRLFPAAVKLLESSYSVLRTPLQLPINPLPTQPRGSGLGCSAYQSCHECTDTSITGATCSWCKGATQNSCVASNMCPEAKVVTASGAACENCGCSGEIVPMTKDLLQKYSNYTDHDLVLFVTAHSTRLFSGQTLAYACSCRSNILGRPTFGHINWGSNTINFGATDRIDLQLGVAVHEMTHALVFASQNFKNFLDTSKSSQYLGKTLGPDFDYPKRTSPPATDQVVVTAKGLQNVDVKKTITYIKTPKVLEKARAHFGCPTLPGVELEDAGSSGTAGSHWEKRLFNNEYMTGSSAFDPVYSDITMALFEDSGWYQVNYSAAAEFYFGRGEGCDFVRPRCDKWLGSYQCTPAERGYWGCTFDYRARGVCSITQYTQALQPWNQYFLNNATMGGSELPDFCPFYTYTANLQSYCGEPSYQADNLAIRGEHFLPSSRCLDSTLLSNTKKGLKGSGACYDVRCIKNKLFVRVANRFYDCSQPGTEIKVTGYNGYVKCPSALLGAELCAQAPKADALPVVKSVKPASGRRPRKGDRFDVTGEGLESIAAIIIGDQRCTKLIGAPTKTSVSCEFEEPKAMAPTPAPTPAPTQDFIGVLTDIFVENKDALLPVVVETADGLAGVLVDGFLVDGSARVYLSAMVMAVVAVMMSI
jgi:leishmanolysin-like peptidase